MSLQAGSEAVYMFLVLFVQLGTLVMLLEACHVGH